MATDEKADLNAEHIEGFLPGSMGLGSVPLISHIEDNLWVGGCIPGVKLPDDFEFVVSLYPWGRYELGPETSRLELRLYDAPIDSDEFPERDVLDLARMAHAFVSKGKTLIHCQAGLNRSNLIATLVLMRVGMSAENAIALLRERRSPLVLINESFEAWLRNRSI